jgi:putative transposase
VLAVVDEYTRKCFRIEVDTSINGVRVARALTEIAQMEGLPEVIVIDNGPEFISNALDAWANNRGQARAGFCQAEPHTNHHLV